MPGTFAPVRVMLEQGRKRTVAVAFDWPGWERHAKSSDPVAAEGEAMAILAAYRPRYAVVAQRASLGSAFASTGELTVVERYPATGMGEFYGVSGRSAESEQIPMSANECERKIALLRAAWSYFDDVAAHVSAELRTGPRGGGRDRERIVRHANGAEFHEFARKVGVVTDPDTWRDPVALWAHRDAVCAAIRDYNARGAPARTWTVQFTLRRCAYHMLDHAWEMEDRDLSPGRDDRGRTPA
jgi:hypothetical protein